VGWKPRRQGKAWGLWKVREGSLIRKGRLWKVREGSLIREGRLWKWRPFRTTRAPCRR
jgi:hypothetical protein